MAGSSSGHPYSTQPGLRIGNRHLSAAASFPFPDFAEEEAPAVSAAAPGVVAFFAVVAGVSAPFAASAVDAAAPSVVVL